MIRCRNNQKQRGVELMKYGWLMMALATGLLIPVQAAANAKLRLFTVQPLYSALLSFLMGAAALMAVTGLTVVMGQTGNLRNALNAPWWAWTGGVIGAAFVTVAIFAIPQTGAATFLVANVAGQMIGAIVLDHFGWLGLNEKPVTVSRLAGAALLLAGVWLIQRK
jgi:transporter family-2 protein